MSTRSQSYVQFVISSFSNIIQEIRHTKKYANSMLDKAGKICKTMIDEILDENKCRRSRDEMPFAKMSSEKMLLEVKVSLIAIEKMISDNLQWTKNFDEKVETKNQFKVDETTKDCNKHSKLTGKTCHIDTKMINEPIFPTHNTNKPPEPTKNTNQKPESTKNSNHMSEPTLSNNMTLDLSSSSINLNDDTIEHSVDGSISQSSNDISASRPFFGTASSNPNSIHQPVTDTHRIGTHKQQAASQSGNSDMEISVAPPLEPVTQSLVAPHQHTSDFTKKQSKSVLGGRNEPMTVTKTKHKTLFIENNSMSGSMKQSLNSTTNSTMDANSQKMETGSVGVEKKNVPHNPYEPDSVYTASTAESHVATNMDYNNIKSVKSKNIKSEQSEITHVHMMPDHQILILRDTIATETKTTVKGKSVSGKSDATQSVKDNISGQYTLYLFRKTEDTAFFNFIVEDGNEPVQVSGVELIDENGEPTIHLLLVLRSKAKEQLVMNYILVSAKRFKGLIFLKDFQVGEPCYLRTRVQEKSFDILLLNDRTSLICFRFSRTTIDWYNKLKDKNAKLKMLRDELPGGEVIDFHHAKPLNSEPISRVAILVQWPESEHNKAYRAMIVIATLHSKDSQGLLTFNVEQNIMLNQPTMDSKLFDRHPEKLFFARRYYKVMLCEELNRVTAVALDMQYNDPKEKRSYWCYYKTQSIWLDNDKQPANKDDEEDEDGINHLAGRRVVSILEQDQRKIHRISVIHSHRLLQMYEENPTTPMDQKTIGHECKPRLTKT